MFKKTVRSCQWGKHQLRIETGEMARQATSSVVVDVDETTILATVVASSDLKPEQDFFPLTIDYLEKSYAAGRIPGGFFRREGRASEQETLIARLVDRPLRPLFPENFYHEVQVVLHVLSLNPEVPPDIVAIIAASTALSLSGLPFQGPVAAARVGYNHGQYILNPTSEEQAQGALDLVIAGTEQAVSMVEADAQELPEEIMFEAIVYGHKQIQPVITLIKEVCEEAENPEWAWQNVNTSAAIANQVQALATEGLQSAFRIQEKQKRTHQLKLIRQQVAQKLLADGIDFTHLALEKALFNLEASLMRGQILAGKPRIDGRCTDTVRPIAIRTAVLPRVHGSALFTRGETQALVTATLGTARDEQIIDALAGETRERFLLHYNMPAFATGETGRVGAPKRREIGHGRLARRALAAVLPGDDFAYTIRVVSEILESNGSSSMASVCGASLALMDAGVPLKSHVAGIAMGLILENNRFSVLTDILGDEDHLGDMDFKVAGTRQGITALQMDIKICGLPKEIMKVALAQAYKARLLILDKMEAVISSPREEVSVHAPRMLNFRINPEKIRDVIGKGGATIQSLTKDTGAEIDIQDDGMITISAIHAKSLAEAKARIEALTAEAEVGKIYVGTVVKIINCGAIVNLFPGKDGLLHISEISHERIKDVKSWVQEGQTVKVKVLSPDDKGRLRLSLKAAAADEMQMANHHDVVV